jgi:hypothetical protein
MNNFYPATGIDSGVVGHLPTIDGTDLVDKDGALVIESSRALIYTLDEFSGEAVDPPNILSPDTNAGDKRWKLVQMFNMYDGALTQLIYSNFPGGF